MVTLSNSAPSALTVPSSVTVAANATSATFTASTGALISDQTATVTATLNGSSKSATLSLLAPVTLSSLQCAAASLASNASTTCTVTLSKSTTSSTVVTLSNSAPSVLDRSLLRDRSGQRHFRHVHRQHRRAVSDQTATITATLNGSSKSVTLSLTTPPDHSLLPSVRRRQPGFQREHHLHRHPVEIRHHQHRW